MKKLHVPMFDLRVTDLALRDELLESVATVFDHGRLFLGPEVEQFEEQTAGLIGTKYAVGVSSGSSALYLALKASGVGLGDEVITTPLTWVISSNAISACGATPVFADVSDDFNIDPRSIEQNITTKTKAIVPVHYAGHMCNMPAITDIAEENDLIIVEDAAQAFGAALNGRMAGSFSLAAGLSMNPMKVLAGYGEAGVVVTNEESVYRRLIRLRHAGTTSDPKKIITNDCREISLNHKMDTINAALLLVALKYLNQRKKIRDDIAERYSKELPASIGRQRSTAKETHARYVYPIRTCWRNELKSYLEDHTVETKIMHEPLVCDAPIYKDIRSHVPTARRVLESSLVIPSNEKLSSDQISYVIQLIQEFVGTKGIYSNDSVASDLGKVN